MTSEEFEDYFDILTTEYLVDLRTQEIFRVYDKSYVDSRKTIGDSHNRYEKQIVRRC